MTPFSYPDASSPDPVRADLAEAHRRAWQHIARPGTWLTGAERVAVADETRRARDCVLCRERKQALSPFAVEGEHDHGDALPESLVDEVHRVTTDAARLSESWYRSLLEAGLDAEAYVEALGVSVLVISVDRLPPRASGLPRGAPAGHRIAGEPMPLPAPGRSRRPVRPGCRMIESRKQVGPAERELGSSWQAPAAPPP